MHALVARQRRWLLAQASALCRNPADAEDLTQETIVRFLSTFGKVSQLPDDNICASWLVTTLTHCFYDQLRKQRTRERSASELARQALAVDPEPPARPLYERVSDEQFSSAVQALSPAARTTFELHARGRKYKEIAEELGIQEGTVAKRLHDARSRLRKLLDPLIQLGEN
ncbi:RNA polymerase sigma factor [Archangium violaceum]|uniref:RNA polymerase sigma factor n=1 Tax=Archangium violaceum TaxID=83451 RepID=UPI00193C7845|nr:RNA polymerase sigma factor [Archangium violaceum]QRK11515.1 RNA polymerase sigma factor [Archangium violaceum]